MRLTGRHICIFLVFSVLVSCSSTVRYSSASTSSEADEQNVKTNTTTVPGAFTQTGMASFYADKFEGHQTASGEIFEQDKFTAAHRTLPFGTKLKVTNLSNGKSVIVTVNDRGPFADDRIIDLSKAAAEQLDMIKSGVIPVKIEVINN